MSRSVLMSILLCMILVGGCSISPVQDEPSLPEVAPSATTKPEPSPTTAPSPTLSPTTTDVPPELSEAAKQSYLAMLLIQINSQLVEDAANKTYSGELAGFDQLGVLLAISAVIEGVDQSIPEITPPNSLMGDWEEILEIHEQTKQIMGSWFNDEIEASAVLDQISPLIRDADDHLQDVERKLSKEFKFDPMELTSAREEILASIPEIFESTPTPGS